MSYSNPTQYQIEKRLENIKERSRMIHYCPHCDSYGQGQKMYTHIKNCDGSGFKNYWSKIKSDLLRNVAIGIWDMEEAEAMFQELKDKARRNQIHAGNYVENQIKLAQKHGLNAWERVTPPRG